MTTYTNIKPAMRAIADGPLPLKVAGALALAGIIGTPILVRKASRKFDEYKSRAAAALN